MKKIMLKKMLVSEKVVNDFNFKSLKEALIYIKK